MQPKLRVVPGRHHDPAEPWAREPRLRPVIETRGMTAAETDTWFGRLLVFLFGFFAGVVAVAMLAGRL